MAATPSGRVRDPDRKERILEAAAALISKNGYQGVNLDDIGTAAGIVGSGIYRHFGSKVAILVELFDRVVDRLVDEAERALEDERDPARTLAQLVNGQILFTVNERQLCKVYIDEARNLPETDQRRLRWKQRHYIDLWHDVLLSIRPQLAQGEVQTLVYAAIGGIHSILRYEPVLKGTELELYLTELTSRTLGVELLSLGPAGVSDEDG